MTSIKFPIVANARTLGDMPIAASVLKLKSLYMLNRNLRFIMKLVAFFALVSCSRSNTNADKIIGKWKMIERRNICSDSKFSNRLNVPSYTNDSEFVFEFDQKAFRTLGYLNDKRTTYKFEGDSLVMNYQSNKSYFITKAYADFSLEETLVLTQHVKDVDCILIATLKRIE